MIHWMWIGCTPLIMGQQSCYEWWVNVRFIFCPWYQILLNSMYFMNPDVCLKLFNKVVRYMLLPMFRFWDHVHTYIHNASDWGWNTCDRGCLSILLFSGTWLVFILTGLTKFGTTELEGKLGLVIVLCSLLTEFWIWSWITVHVVDTHGPTCLPNVLSGHLCCMSVRLGRVKHNSVSLRTDWTDLSKVFLLWMSTD